MIPPSRQFLALPTGLSLPLSGTIVTICPDYFEDPLKSQCTIRAAT